MLHQVALNSNRFSNAFWNWVTSDRKKKKIVLFLKIAVWFLNSMIPVDINIFSIINHLLVLQNSLSKLGLWGKTCCNGAFCDSALHMATWKQACNLILKVRRRQIVRKQLDILTFLSLNRQAIFTRDFLLYGGSNRSYLIQQISYCRYGMNSKTIWLDRLFKLQMNIMASAISSNYGP